MSELITVLNSLKADFVKYDKLWEEAIECGNEALAVMLQEELIAINTMINEIEKEENDRQRREMGTRKWREFYVVK